MNDGYYNGAGLNISQAAHGDLRVRQVEYDGSAVQRAVMSGADAQQAMNVPWSQEFPGVRVWT